MSNTAAEGTIKSLDQIEAPDDLKQMVDPASSRQASILEQFLAEVGAANGPPEPADEELAQQPSTGDQKAELLLGKFKTPAELAKAYQELERRLGQPAEAEPPAPATPAPEDYTPEKGVEVYGEALAGRIAAAGINPFEMWRKLEAGDDVAPFVDALVEKGGIPRPLVETYLQGVKPPAATAAAPGAGAAVSLNDNPEAVAAVRQSVGGDEAFERLSRWAAANLSDAEKSEYQTAVDSGNAAAVQWALKAFQARASNTKTEPLFLGGAAQASDTGDTYATWSEWQTERYAKNANGDELYLKDDRYQQRVDAKHRRSKAAGKW